MRDLGWAVVPESVFEQKRTTSEVVVPSGPEIAHALPRLLSVDPARYKTRQLLLRIQQDESGAWTVGYRRTRLSKAARSLPFFLKEFSWSNKLLINALAECWIGLKERGF